MRSLLDWIRGRLLPALVTAAGVVLLMAGLLSYQDPPQAAALAPSAAPSAEPSGPVAQTPRPSLPPIPTRAPSTSRRAVGKRHGGPRREPGRRPGPANRPPRRAAPRRSGPLPVLRRRRVPSLSSSSRAPRARRTSSPTPARGCSCPCSGPRTRRWWGCSSRSTRATTSSSSTRSPGSCATRTASTSPSGRPTEQLVLQTSEGPPGGRARPHRPGDDGRGSTAERRTGRPEGRQPGREAARLRVGRVRPDTTTPS